MSLRQLGGVLAGLGALVWIVRWFVIDGAAALDLTRWVGLGSVLAGLVCVGLTLVNGTALWLDAVVGAAVPLLFWAVYESLRTGLDGDVGLHALIGAVVLVVSLWTVAVGGRPRRVPTGSGAPSHRA